MGGPPGGRKYDESRQDIDYWLERLLSQLEGHRELLEGFLELEGNRRAEGCSELEGNRRDKGFSELEGHGALMTGSMGAVPGARADDRPEMGINDEVITTERVIILDGTNKKSHGMRNNNVTAVRRRITKGDLTCGYCHGGGGVMPYGSVPSTGLCLWRNVGTLLNEIGGVPVALEDTRDQNAPRSTHVPTVMLAIILRFATNINTTGV